MFMFFYTDFPVDIQTGAFSCLIVRSKEKDHCKVPSRIFEMFSHILELLERIRKLITKTGQYSNEGTPHDKIFIIIPVCHKDMLKKLKATTQSINERRL
jgi:hypothetical protein